MGKLHRPASRRLDHAVNAMVAARFDRATAAARRADAAVARGDALAGAARPADRHQGPGRHRGPADHPGQRHLPRPRPQGRRNASSPRRGRRVPSSSARPTRPSSAPAPTRATRCTAPPANPFDPMKSCAGSSGGSAVALATGMRRSARDRTPAAACATPPRSAGSSASARRPAWCRATAAASAGATCPSFGPMARNVPDACLLLSAIAGDDSCDPLATTVHGRAVHRPEDFATPAPIDLSRLRVALTPDFGFAPTERHIAEMFREKTGCVSSCLRRAEDTSPDCTRRGRGVRSAARHLVLATHSEKGAGTARRMSAPNVRANVEEGQRYTAAGRGAGADAADHDVPAVAGLLRRLRRDPDAVDHHQSALMAGAVIRPEIDGKPNPHLLPLAWRWPTR